MSQKRILIYSKKCISCSNLIVLLQNMNMLLSFELVCFDDLIRQNKALPTNIERVPALILPEMNMILQGKETFEWVDKIRINIIKMNIATNMQQSGPNGFTSVEMGGFSDNFAYTMTDLAQPKSFLPYKKDEEYGIYTGIEASKIKKTDLEKLIQNTEKVRKEQEKEINNNYNEKMKDIALQQEKQKIMSNVIN
jgi:hypothetical protein